MKAGAVIFMTTEGWAFGTAIYFCNHLTAYFFSLATVLIRYSGFITFSTVGYGKFSFQLCLSFTQNIHAGDYAPQTQAGRSIFVVWSLLGVITMTILISSTAVNTTLTRLFINFDIAYSPDRGVLKNIQECY